VITVDQVKSLLKADTSPRPTGPLLRFLRMPCPGTIRMPEHLHPPYTTSLRPTPFLHSIVWRLMKHIISTWETRSSYS
jgi:hypothetical protein